MIVRSLLGIGHYLWRTEEKRWAGLWGVLECYRGPCFFFFIKEVGGHASFLGSARCLNYFCLCRRDNF